MLVMLQTRTLAIRGATDIAVGVRELGSTLLRRGIEEYLRRGGRGAGGGRMFVGSFFYTGFGDRSTIV